MLPDIMRYRQMKTAYRQKTYVRNSPIHSLGLFAKAEYAAAREAGQYKRAFELVAREMRMVNAGMGKELRD